MTLAAMVLGYATLGLGVRCYALGIQKRNLMENLGGHAMAMIAFGGIGYYLHGVEAQQNIMIERKRAEIASNRTRMQELQRAGQEKLAEEGKEEE